MKQRLLILFALSGSLLCSCESEDLENWQVKKPNGQVASEKELSAGISTIFSNAPGMRTIRRQTGLRAN